MVHLGKITPYASLRRWTLVAGASILVTAASNKALAQCEVAKLMASDAAPGDGFGSSISSDGDLLVVGAPYDDDGGASSGSIYVFRRVGASWTEEAKLTASDPSASARFGRSVSISGDTILVGAPYDGEPEYPTGSAYFFRRTESNWVEEKKFTVTASNNLGWSVAIDGARALVSTFYPSSTYVFRYESDEWLQPSILIPQYVSSWGRRFGYSVALRGDQALVSDLSGGTDSVYVFQNAGTCWIQEARLDGIAFRYSDAFGYSVALSESRLVVGTTNSGQYGNGYASVFKRDGATWIEEAQVVARDSSPLGSFGRSVAVLGDSMLVGATGGGDSCPPSSSCETGATYVFHRTGASWMEAAKLIASDAQYNDWLGGAVTINQPFVFVSAVGNDERGDGAGAVYVFDLFSAPDCDLNGINDACQPDCNANGIPDGCDIVDGTSTDCNGNKIADECEPDCNSNSVADECDIRDETSADCNGNGVPDECDLPLPDCNSNSVADGCDIAALTSDDCDGNGVPDECEPFWDCNENGLPDRCELATGTAKDCNVNWIPDECDISDGPSLDCNSNAIPDECDILELPNGDWNQNGVPDDCEPCGGPQNIPCPAGHFCSAFLGVCNVIDYVGMCRRNDLTYCPGIGGPVICGCDGEEYESECVADISSMSILHIGVCEDPPTDCCLPTTACAWTEKTSLCLAAEGVPVASCLGDADGDGMADACESVCCPSSSPPAPQLIQNASGKIVVREKGRFLSFTAGESGLRHAIRIIIVSLPPPFDGLNGSTFWVGQPRLVSENPGSVDPIPGFANFNAATLQCDPFFMDWSAVGAVHVYDETIIPSSLYSIEIIAEDCGYGVEAFYSPPLHLATSRWGDVTGPFDNEQGLWTAPDGSVRVPTDVVATLNKFTGQPDAPEKTQVDISPATPDHVISVNDLTRMLDAFRGLPYPFPVTSPCP